MLFVDTMRGWDSTGVFGIDKHGNVEINKAALDGPDFVKTKEYKDFHSAAIKAGVCMVGHNRAATRGDVTDANAHPFWKDDKIILVQNGTWRGDHKHVKDTEVDTEAITHLLAEEDDIEKAIQKVNAAYVLVWYNTKTKCLHMIRNHERPLFIVKTKSGGLMFASELGTILWAAERNHITIEDTPKMLKPKHLLTVQFNGARWELSSKDIDSDYRGTPFRQPYNHHGGQSHCGWGNDNEDNSLVMWHEHNVEEIRRSSRHAFQQAAESSQRQLDSSKHDIKKTIERHAVEFKNAHCNPDDLDYLREYMETYAKSNDGVVIELQDYYAANDNRNCRCWYVVGHVFDEHWPENTPAPMVYWIIHGEETEILDYVSHGWYRGKLQTPIPRYITNNRNERKLVMGCYVTETHRVNVETHEVVH